MRSISNLLTYWKKGWIQPSFSQYNYLLLFVKKEDGTLCMYIGYRALNANKIIDTHPILCIDNIFDYLKDSVIFSKINLTQGYHQVWIAKGHEHRTAFQTCFRLFEDHVLLFGLCNAPETFQRLMYK